MFKDTTPEQAQQDPALLKACWDFASSRMDDLDELEVWFDGEHIATLREELDFDKPEWLQ